MRWIVRILLALLIIPLVLLIVLALLPGEWLARQISAVASQASGLNVEIADASLSVFTLTPGISLSDIEATDRQDEPVAKVSRTTVNANLRALLTDAPLLDQVIVNGVSVELAVDDEGDGNWAGWLPQAQEPPSQKIDDPIPTIPAIRQVQLSDVQINYNNTRLQHELSLVMNAEGSTSQPTQPLSVDGKGTFNQLPLSLDLTVQSLLAVATRQDDVEMDLTVELGDTVANVAGVVGNTSTFRELDLTFILEGPNLEDLAVVASQSLPVLPPFSVDGSLLRDGDEFVLQRFDAEVGDSDLEGDVRLNPVTQPVTLYANVISTVFDLDDLAGLIGASPDPDEAATAEQVEQLEQSQPAGRFLSDNPIALTTLATLINGKIAFRANEVRTELFPVDSIDVQLDFQPQRLLVDPLTVGLAGGVADGSIDIDVKTTPVTSTLELRLKRVDLRKVMARAGFDNEAFGQVGGRAKYWLKGDTLASMVGSADGGMFFLMTDGKIDALLTELAGIDLVESITLLASNRDENTEIRCAYADIHSREGLMTIQTFVVDTDDTVFLADGTVDFNDETLDLTLEPHPKDISLLAAQTSVNITGKLTDPSILPGKSLPLRAAAAAVLASVAGPAAALLPFIESGSSADSPYCSGLINSLDDAR